MSTWGGDPVLERRERALHDRLEELGGLEQDPRDERGVVDDRSTVTGRQRARAARRHGPQPLGPVPRVALDLLGVAGVRHAPDDQVPRAQHAAVRAVHPGVVVGLAPAVVQLEGDAADLDGHVVAVGDRRGVRRGLPADLGRPRHLVVRRDARELAVVHRDVVVRGARVAVEALLHRLVADHHRRRLPLDQERREAEGVVDVAVGVDGGVHRRLGALTQRSGQGRAELHGAGVDQHQSRRRSRSRSSPTATTRTTSARRPPPGRRSRRTSPPRAGGPASRGTCRPGSARSSLVTSIGRRCSSPLHRRVVAPSSPISGSAGPDRRAAPAVYGRHIGDDAPVPTTRGSC